LAVRDFAKDVSAAARAYQQQRDPAQRFPRFSSSPPPQKRGIFRQGQDTQLSDLSYLKFSFSFPRFLSPFPLQPRAADGNPLHIHMS